MKIRKQYPGISQANAIYIMNRCTLSYHHQTEVWPIRHCLWLCHETMVCAVCLSIFLCYYVVVCCIIIKYVTYWSCTFPCVEFVLHIALAKNAMGTLIQDAPLHPGCWDLIVLSPGANVWHGQCPDAQLRVGHQLGAASVCTHLLEHGPQEKLFHRLLPNISTSAITESMASKC